MAAKRQVHARAAMLERAARGRHRENTPTPLSLALFYLCPRKIEIKIAEGRRESERERDSTSELTQNECVRECSSCQPTNLLPEGTFFFFLLKKWKTSSRKWPHEKFNEDNYTPELVALEWAREFLRLPDLSDFYCVALHVSSLKWNFRVRPICCSWEVWNYQIRNVLL